MAIICRIVRKWESEEQDDQLGDDEVGTMSEEGLKEMSGVGKTKEKSGVGDMMNGLVSGCPRV